jgi:uncharacterized membrane protein
MEEKNHNSRLEAFCDGVFAIAITLLIIDIKIPSSITINNTADFWHALVHIAPSIFAFVLSFGIILITWVNHHNFLKLVDKSCGSFIYANGFMLLTVAFIPFPTSLLGEYLLTDHAGPAVCLYNSVIAFQSIGWVLIGSTITKNHLGKSERSTLKIRQGTRFGYYAFAIYSMCAFMAFWFPLTVAIVTAIIWIFWLVYGITIRQE